MSYQGYIAPKKVYLLDLLFLLDDENTPEERPLYTRKGLSIGKVHHGILSDTMPVDPHLCGRGHVDATAYDQLVDIIR